MMRYRDRRTQRAALAGHDDNEVFCISAERGRRNALRLGGCHFQIDQPQKGRTLGFDGHIASTPIISARCSAEATHVNGDKATRIISIFSTRQFLLIAWLLPALDARSVTPTLYFFLLEIIARHAANFTDIYAII